MKNLYLLAFATLLGTQALASTELVENSGGGASFVDPVNRQIRLNYRNNFSSASIDNRSCGSLKIIKRVVDGQVIVERNTEAELTCDTIKSSLTAVIDCEEKKAYFVNLQDPKCSSGACQSTPSVSTKTQSFSYDNFYKDIQSCSPNDEIMIIKDSAGHALVSSLKDNEQCGKRLEKRTLATGNKLWDQENDDNFRLKVGSSPGFYVGNHTHYFFDFNKKQWCIHFKPTNPQSQFVCDNRLNNMTRSIGFSNGDIKKNKGVVKLSIDKNGNPVAQIGYPQSEEFSYTPDLDESRPVLQVTLSNDPKKGRRSLFELRDSANGPVVGKMEVSPNYLLGKNLTANACTSANCLNLSSEVLAGAKQAGAGLSCSSEKPLDMQTASGQCYSCYGVTPGNCGENTLLITSSGQKDSNQDTRTFLSASKALNDLKSCQQSTPQTDSESPDTAR